MFKKLSLILPILAISSCINMAKVEHGKLGKAHTKYNKILAEEYSKLTKENAKEYDWVDAERFASKAVSASKDKKVMPDDPNSKYLKAELRAEFNEYHDIVDMLMTDENKAKHPKQLAKLVVSYDDLLDTQSDTFSSLDKVLHKRSKFLHNVRYFLGQTAFLPHKNVMKSETVFFGTDSHKLSKLSKKLIRRTVMHLKHGKAMKFTKVVIASHADKVGSNHKNYNVSLERAAAVKNYLISLGIKEQNIEIVNYGETKPVEDTKGSSLKNRRVEIDFIN